MTRLRVCMLLLSFFLLGLAANGAADGTWLKSVPGKDHEKSNPYQGKADAIAAGQNIFEEHCSKCHGENAEGTRKRPSLRTERVQKEASPGDLHWLLINGNMRKGMPSWAKLPDPQLWQLVSYLKSMHD